MHGLWLFYSRLATRARLLRLLCGFELVLQPNVESFRGLGGQERALGEPWAVVDRDAGRSLGVSEQHAQRPPLLAAPLVYAVLRREVCGLHRCGSARAPGFQVSTRRGLWSQSAGASYSASRRGVFGVRLSPVQFWI